MENSVALFFSKTEKLPSLLLPQRRAHDEQTQCRRRASEQLRAFLRAELGPHPRAVRMAFPTSQEKDEAHRSWSHYTVPLASSGPLVRAPPAPKLPKGQPLKEQKDGAEAERKCFVNQN